jgi:hypothetical protein
MELKEGLAFYKRCLADCDRVLADLLARDDLTESRKEALIDKQLDVRNKLKKTIEVIEQLLM